MIRGVMMPQFVGLNTKLTYDIHFKALSKMKCLLYFYIFEIIFE